MDFTRGKVADRDLLLIALDAAVPLYEADISRQFRRGYATHKTVAKRAAYCGRLLAEKGDALMWRQKTGSGRSQEVFGALAEGIACMLQLRQPGEREATYRRIKGMLREGIIQMSI